MSFSRAKGSLQQGHWPLPWHPHTQPCVASAGACPQRPLRGRLQIVPAPHGLGLTSQPAQSDVPLSLLPPACLAHVCPQRPTEEETEAHAAAAKHMDDLAAAALKATRKAGPEKRDSAV